MSACREMKIDPYLSPCTCDLGITDLNNNKNNNNKKKTNTLNLIEEKVWKNIVLASIDCQLDYI